MVLALDLGRFHALDTEHPSTEADDLPLVGNDGFRGKDAGEVTEDGVLFSTVRSTSIGSTPQPSQRSISLLAK
jgi:hypothetical protein